MSQRSKTLALLFTSLLMVKSALLLALTMDIGFGHKSWCGTVQYGCNSKGFWTKKKNRHHRKTTIFTQDRFIWPCYTFLEYRLDGCNWTWRCFLHLHWLCQTTFSSLWKEGKWKVDREKWGGTAVNGWNQWTVGQLSVTEYFRLQFKILTGWAVEDNGKQEPTVVDTLQKL